MDVRLRLQASTDLIELFRSTLCAFHHLRGVHAGRLRVSGLPPLLRYRSGDRVTWRAAISASRSASVNVPGFCPRRAMRFATRCRARL